MTDEVLKPVELGFAEFVAKLIADVFDATIGAQAEQNEKLAELETLLQQSELTFVDSLLAKPDFVKELDKMLADVFPGSGDAIHPIYVGADYQPGAEKQTEQPAIKKYLGYEIQSGDYITRTKKLTEQGVLNIFRHIAMPVAQKKRAILLRMMENGLPNIVVDKGKINAKLTFNTSLLGSSGADGTESSMTTSSDTSIKDSASFTKKTTLSSETNESTITRAATTSLTDSIALSDKLSLSDRLISPIQPIDRFVGLIKPNIKDQVRLTVKQASNKSPQDTQATTNIFSEVEIHFKTIN
ncbi:MAG: hypothetical protein HWE27_08470 [Gammaproteobacteria bacterium]|nr:hypothetical protein [Gammaproteobacteria bacterium]